MNLIIKIFIFILCFMGSINSYSQQNPEIFYQKFKIDIQINKIGNNYYINLKELAKIFYNKTDFTINQNSIASLDEKLIFASESFFIVYKNYAGMRVAQMSLPCIQIKEELFIPVYAFFNAVNSIQLINVNLHNNLIEIIENNIFVPAEIKIVEEKIINSNLDRHNQINSTQKEEKNIVSTTSVIKPVNTLPKKSNEKTPKLEIQKDKFEFQTEDDTPKRGLYSIPRKLKK